MNQIASVTFKPGLPQECELIDVTTLIEYNKPFLTTVHRAEFHHIIWFQEGNPMHVVDFEKIPITPDSLLFIKKDIVHHFDPKHPFKAKALIFTDNFIMGNPSDAQLFESSLLFNELFGPQIIQMKQDPNLYNIWNLLTTEFTHPKDQFQEELLKKHLQTFLLQAERINANRKQIDKKPGISLSRTLAFKKLLDQDFKTHKQVAHFAKLLQLNEKSLNKATTETLGKTAKQLIDARILLEAKRLLIHTNTSIKELGYALGFDEPTNFVKFFKKHTQQTPLFFKKQLHA